MAASKQQSPAEQHATAAKLGWRGWIAAHRLISVVAAVVIFGIAPLVGLSLLTPAARQEGPATLADALAALDAGELALAGEIANRLIDATTSVDGEPGGPALVLGAVASQQADSLWDENRKQMSLLAARHLEDAVDLGIPHERRAEAFWLLGKNLFRSGRLEDCRQPLEQALPLASEHASVIHLMLTEAYQHGDDPDLDAALRHSRAYVADDELYIEDRQQGLLEQAKILFRLKDFAGSRAVIETISKNAPEQSESRLLLARMLMAEAVDNKSPAGAIDEAGKVRLSTAIETLEAARTAGSAKDRVSTRAAYLIGRCQELLGDSRQALKLYGEVGDSASPESIAAEARAAVLLLTEGRHEEAAAALAAALSKAKPGGHGAEPWMSPDALREAGLQAFQELFDAGQFERALALLKGFCPAFSRTQQLQLVAQTHRAWAVSLQQEDSRSASAAQHRLERENQYRQAGHCYRQLASLRFAEREFPDDLWDCIECYTASHDYALVVDVLQTYLKYEPVRRRAAALQRLGEALLVEGRTEEAAAALQESVEFDPRNAAIYRSKILASKAMVDAGNLDAARALLMDNLGSEFLTPASMEWRETLFQLGRLLHLDGDHEEAIQRLEEAVARYPADDRTTLARYLIADSYRQLARDLLAGLDSIVVESARVAQTREAHRLLDAAIAQFDLATAALESIIERGDELTEADAAMLRNCHFMKGAALFDQGRYEEAIRAYSSATNRYQHEPEVLDAYVKVADCYRRLNRTTEARGTIEQAKVVLSKMPTDLDFLKQTNFDRQEWARHLEWLSSL